MTDKKEERKRAEQQLVSLQTTIRAIQERVMRREVVAERIFKLSSTECTELLWLICTQAPTDPIVAQILLAFQSQGQSQHKLSYDKIRKIYEHARECKYHNVQRLFLSFASSQKKEEDEPPFRTHPQLEGVTLGQRKFLARKLDIQMLEKLLSDPDPSVIHNLLHNPRMTEKEVLQIATKRPTRPEILEVIANSNRWFPRYRVKSALVQNPYTPFSIALQALPFLKSNDLTEIALSNRLHPQIIKASEECLRIRAQTSHTPQTNA